MRQRVGDETGGGGEKSTQPKDPDSSGQCEKAPMLCGWRGIWAEQVCVCVCVCVCVGQGLFTGSCSRSGCEGSGGVPGPRLSPYLERDLRDTLNQPTQRQRHQSGLCQTGLNQVKSSVFVRACASAHVRLKMYVTGSQSQLIYQPAFIIIIITVITQPIHDWSKLTL